MIKKCLKFVMIALCLCHMQSCSRINHINNTLSKVDFILDKDPKTALEKLDSIDQEMLVTRKMKARYALLRSISLDKNFIDLTTDTLIAPAVKYYNNHGSSDDKLKTLYYLGRIQYNAGNYNQAIVTLMKSLQFSDTASSIRTCALVHNLLVATYINSYMYSDAFEHIDKAYDYAVQCNDLRLADTILYRKAQLYNNSKQYDKAIELYSKIITANSISNELMSEVLCSYAHTLIVKDIPDYKFAVDLYERSLRILPSFNNPTHWGAYAYALNLVGRNDHSEKIFSQLKVLSESPELDIAFKSWRQHIYKKESRYKEAYDLISSIIPYQDSLFRVQMQNSGAKAQRDFWILKNTEQSIRQRHRSVVLFLVIISLFLSITVLYNVYRKRFDIYMKEKSSLFEISEAIRRQLRETEEDLRKNEEQFTNALTAQEIEINRLRSNISEREDKLKLLRADYAKMYKSQFKGLGELCEIFIRANEYNDSHKRVYNKVKEMLREINGDQEGHARFEKKINKTLNNIMVHFREDFPNYSESDYRFISYIIVGFDATTLAVIFDMPSLAAVYMKKSRIKKHIQDSASDYTNIYLEMLN